MSLLQRLETFQRSKRAKTQGRSKDKGTAGRINEDSRGDEAAAPQQLASANGQSEFSAGLSEQKSPPARGAGSNTDSQELQTHEASEEVERADRGQQATISGRMNMGASSFYGKSRLRQVERCVLRLMAAVRKKLQGHAEDPFRIFPFQEPALSWADAHNSAGILRIFSVERSADGRRAFIVTTYAAFWARYEGMLPQHRHYYEIIRQGAPCHLYFDLEYQKEHNQDVDGDQLVKALLELCDAALKERFVVQLEDSWIIELDSSTPAKFSRHLVIRVPGAAFQSNFHVGAFVRDLCEAPGDAAGAEGAASRQPRQELLVNKGADGDKALFVDGGVYTRNRAFRLFLSSKAGKEAVLQLTERFQGARLSHREAFHRALICNVEEGCRLLRCFDDAEGATFSWAGCRAGTRADAVTSLERCPNPKMGPSCHPDVEAFITSMCTQGGVQGQVRSWVDWPEAGLLLLNMRGNRWCGNVGRTHKSNGIFYVVDLQGGVWYQKCYDPECRSYRSEIMPLPPAIMQRLHTEGAAQAHNSGHPELQAQQQAVSDEGLHIKQPLTAIQQSDVLEVCNRSSPQHEAFWPQIGHRDGCEKENRDQTGEQRSRRDVYDFGTGVLGDFSEADQADGGFDRELLNLLTPSG